MPITVVATDGIFSATAEKTLFAELTASFLRHHDLAGNAFLSPNVIGEISTVPKGRSFAGGTANDIVVVELKVPPLRSRAPGKRRALSRKPPRSRSGPRKAVIRASGFSSTWSMRWMACGASAARPTPMPSSATRSAAPVRPEHGDQTDQRLHVRGSAGGGLVQ